MIANAWTAGRDNPTSKHQIALKLAEQGHRVLWVEGAGMRRPSLAAGEDRGRILRKIRMATRGARRAAAGDAAHDAEHAAPDSSGGVWVLSPLLLPLPSVGLVRRFNGWLYRVLALRWAARLGFDSPVLINYVPVLAEAMRGWPGRTVYHCVDRWDRFEMYDSELMSRTDERCCRLADVVIASSRDLYDRCRERHPDVRLVNHGVDYEHFSAPLRDDGPGASGAPEDLPEGPIVGFFGLLSEWVDQDLLVGLARELPGCRLVLIGRADVPVDRLRREENIVLTGPKPFAELPPYVSRFDAGVIPFVVNELTVAVNPVKLREMLAAGCPVISTALPEVAECGAARAGIGAVVTARNAEEFVARVRERLDAPLTWEQKRSISALVRGETWEAKVREIVGIVGEAPTQPDGGKNDGR
ncbi:glycosyltransferase [Verrucomicrobiota bacterium]